MFQIKICGVTRVDDVEFIATAGADAIGINLVPTSPRYVTSDQAQAISQRARLLGLRVFAVVMDPLPSALAEVVGSLAPDAVQLHGHETPISTEQCGMTAVVKALSWTGRPEEIDLAKLWSKEKARLPLAFLVDAYAPGVGGGTGRVARWDLLNPRPDVLSGVPMLLAGGLTAKNVAGAIEQTQCDGVDTASGVESAAGVKCRDLVEAFVTEARRALLARQRVSSK